jgi:hypothetical protein
MENLTFDTNKINEYWRQFPSLSELFDNMQRIESWILEDDVDVHAKISAWLASLKSSNRLSLLNTKADALIVVMFFLSTKKAMYLYRQLIDVNPALDRSLQLTANQLQDTETNLPAIVFWDRFRTVMIDSGLSDFLGPERLKAIQKSIDFVSKTRGTVS